MLTIIVPGPEVYDHSSEEFTTTDDFVLELEHSLVALSKWESKYEKPFLEAKDKTGEEILDYIKCMVLNPELPEDLFSRLSEENFEAINAYLNAKMTATWFSEQPGAPRTREIITAELVYYWMTIFNIPFECENWNLNRLFTLIRICNIKSAKPKKMSRAEAAARQREMNAQRRAAMKTKG